MVYYLLFRRLVGIKFMHKKAKRQTGRLKF